MLGGLGGKSKDCKGRLMQKSQREIKPTIQTIPSLENLSGRLSGGGDGDFSFYDKPPHTTGTITTGDIAMMVATVSTQLEWTILWARYLRCENAIGMLKLWVHCRLERDSVPIEHCGYLSDIATKAYCDGSPISGRRIAKRLKAGRNNTVPRYVEILDRILYTASVSEEELGFKVYKMSR